MAKDTICIPPEGGVMVESNAIIESRRLAKKATFKKAIAALADVNHVGFKYLTETERDLVEFVRVMLVRKIY